MVALRLALLVAVAVFPPALNLQPQRGLLVDVVVRQGAVVLQLLAGEDEVLLLWREALLVANFLLDTLDGVASEDLQRDGALWHRDIDAHSTDIT